MAYQGDLNQQLYSPQEVVTLATGEIESIQAEGKGMSFGIPHLDHDWVMNKRGKFIGVYADTSHGKSAFAKFASRNFLPQLNEEENEIGIFWTNEDSVESLGIGDLANFAGVETKNIYSGELTQPEKERIGKAEIRRMGSPLWVVGHSVQKKTLNPRLSVYDFIDLMEIVVEKQKKNVRFVWLDYLQQVNISGHHGNSLRVKYDDAISKLRDLARGYNLTVFVNTQTGRHLKDKQWKIPQLGDAKETGGFEEACDGALSMWFVHRDWGIGKEIEVANSMGVKQNIPVTRDLVLMQHLKQKNGKTGDIFALDFVAEYGEYVKYGQANTYRANRKEENERS